MKKFDGLLLCTDWDGTFCVGDYIPKENLDAVRYFQEQGGKFTIASGRFPGYLNPFFQKFKVNAPLILLNGALIYDYDSKTVLDEGFIDEEAYALSRKIIEKNIPYYDVTTYESLASGGRTVTFSVDEFLGNLNLIRQKKIYKLLFKTDTEEKSLLGRQFAQSLQSAHYDAVRSWDISLEIIRKDHNKSAATLYLKEMTNSDTLLCVGDYENDISMLKTADISYATANATPQVKNAAKFATVAANTGAIADIIFRL